MSLVWGLFLAENNQGQKDSGSLSFHLPLDKGPVPGIELSPETSAKNNGLVWWANSAGPRDQSPLCVPWSLHGPTNICLLHICFSIFMWIAFSPFEVPNHCPQHPLLSLAEDGIEGESLGHFGELLSSPGSLPSIHLIRLLFDSVLLICLMLI